MHVFERRLHRQQISARRDLLDMRLFGATGAAARQDLAFLLAPGIADGDAHQETVKLRLGQRVGAFQVDRVLGGDHQKRRVERIRLPLYRYLALLHRLEEGRLGFRRRAVDLVGKQQLGEDRAAAELEPGLALIVKKAAGDVAWQQVGGELDTLEAEVQSLAQQPRD